MISVCADKNLSNVLAELVSSASTIYSQDEAVSLLVLDSKRLMIWM